MRIFKTIVFFLLMSTSLMSQNIDPNGIFYYKKCDNYKPCKVEFWSVIGVADKESGKINMVITPFDKHYSSLSNKKLNGNCTYITQDTIKVEVILNNESTILTFTERKFMSI